MNKSSSSSEEEPPNYQQIEIFFLRETYVSFMFLIEQDLKTTLKNRVGKYAMEIWETSNYLFMAARLIVQDIILTPEEHMLLRKLISRNTSTMTCFYGKSLFSRQFNVPIRLDEDVELTQYAYRYVM